MRTFLLYTFLILSISTLAQQQFSNLDNYSKYKIDKTLNSQKTYIHTGFKPILKSNLNFKYDSVIYEFNRDSVILSKIKHKILWKKLRTESLIKVNENDFFLEINPIFNFAFGKDNLDSNLSVNTRGVEIKGNITEKLSFKTDFYENQAFFPNYISNYAKQQVVIPGQGRLRNFKGSGFDYANASGIISFTPVKWLNFSLGHDKNFIGEGYRSLLLSDNTLSYPSFKIISTFKKLQYIYLLTAFQRASKADTRLLAYQRTHGSFLFLNYIFNNYLQIGVFEGVIYKTSENGINNFFPSSYFNPIIFSRAIGYGFSHKNNVLVGLTSKLKISKGIQTYYQFMIDDDVDKKYGYQIGAKYFNLFSINNLYFQTEYNWVKPYTYSHTDKYQNYSYYNQPLAHPIGSGFSEIMAVLQYRFKDIMLNFRVNYINTSTDQLINGVETNYGVNIFKSDNSASLNPILEAKIGDGNKTERIYHNFQIAYLINPVTNFQVFFEYTHRYEIIGNKSNTEFYYFGIKTALKNYYYDF